MMEICPLTMKGVIKMTAQEIFNQYTDGLIPADEMLNKLADVLDVELTVGYTMKVEKLSTYTGP
jgi:hypothetical protein